MAKKNHFSRREFIAGASTLLVAAQSSGASSAPDPHKLALEGGARTLTRLAPKLTRWGEPEAQQLEEAVKQESLFYWNNRQTKLLTERFQKLYPHKYVQTCSSGSAAVHIATAAAGIAPGDEIITSGITDIGTVIGALFQQAVPVFADLEPNTGCLDPADVERKISPRTKAIIAVHLAGNPRRLTELKELADHHKLVLIEDCAQAWGALYQGKPVSTIGQIGCFSLQDSKHISCGDGGVVASNDEGFGKLLNKFGDKGTNRFDPRDSGSALAANYRMSELQAAFVAAQLIRLEGIASKRAKLGNLLTQELQGIPGITPHQVDPADRCVYWFYFTRLVPSRVRCTRAEFTKALAAEGVTFSNGYIAVPIYGMPMFRNHSFYAGHWPVREMGLTKMDYSQVKCTETEAILETCMLFKLNEAMDEDYIRGVAKAVRKVARYYAA